MPSLTIAFKSRRAAFFWQHLLDSESIIIDMMTLPETDKNASSSEESSQDSHSSDESFHPTASSVLRSNRASNRANRGQADHDIMDGLPVRQWRKQPAIVNLATPKETQIDPADQDSKWRELPMPKGSELYPPWSRAFLRTARAGLIVKPVSNAGEDEKDNGDDEDAEGEPDTGFQVHHWSQIAREVEQPEPEYLAKRRKGLATLYGGAGSSAATATLRKTKVRKIDSDGNAYFLDVLVPEGTVIEGEVAESDNVATQAPPPGTVVEGVGIANAEGVVIAGEQVAPTPPRRRPPPPKRKPKGPGRGRKKKVVIESGVDGAPTAVNANALTNGATSHSLIANGVSAGDGAGAAASPGVDDSTLQDGEEGSEDEEEEGEEGDDADREEGELTDTEDPLSRSATPSKPPRSRSVSKVKDESTLSASAPATDSVTKSTYLAPPIISVSSSVETSSISKDTPLVSVTDLMQSSTTSPPKADVAIPTEADPSIPVITSSEDRTSNSDESGASSNLPAISEALSRPASIDALQPEEAAQSLLKNQSDMLLEDLDAVPPPNKNIIDAITPFTATTSSIPQAALLETALPPPNLSEQTSAPLSVAALTEPIAVAAPPTDPVAPVPVTTAESHNPLDGLSEPIARDQPKEELISSVAIGPNKASQHAEPGNPLAESAIASPEISKDEAAPFELAATMTGVEDDIFGSLERHLQSQSG